MLTFAAHERLRGFMLQLSFNSPSEISNPQHPLTPPSSMENMLITRTDTQDIYNLASCPGLTLRTQLQSKSKSRSSIECKEAPNTDF